MSLEDEMKENPEKFEEQELSDDDLENATGGSFGTGVGHVVVPADSARLQSGDRCRNGIFGL